MWSVLVVYTRPCRLHAYSTWTCIDWLLNDTVAIGNPERHVHKASHRGSKQH